MSGHLKAEPCILLSGRLLRAPQPVRPLGFVFLRAGPGLFPTWQPLQGWHWAELRAEVLEACSGLVLGAQEFPRGCPAGLCRCPSAQGLAGAEPSNSGERTGLLAPTQPRHLHTLCPRCRLTATGPQGRAHDHPALKDDAARRAGVTRARPLAGQRRSWDPHSLLPSPRPHCHFTHFQGEGQALALAQTVPVSPPEPVRGRWWCVEGLLERALGLEGLENSPGPADSHVRPRACPCGSWAVCACVH